MPFELSRQSKAGLVGENGSQKTTLMKIAFGTQLIDEGEV
ncbi:hypothetical protein DRQ00_11770 [candidate division KSB1 bacterium]|nr:MAG: hypothetical protein DRQ00_11770 [candidate division KSB1 bacterium]